MSQSFRFKLALRFSGTMAAGILAISAISLIALKSLLDRELDASILNVAMIQAASLTDSPTGAMHFHDWELTPSEAASVRELNRYAQVWDSTGASLIRSQFMTDDLPVDMTGLDGALNGELIWTEGDFLDGPIRSLYYPLERLGQVHESHVLQVAAPLSSRNGILAQAALLLAVISMLVVVGSFGGSWWLARRAMVPVHRIIDQAEDIGAGSLRQRIETAVGFREYERLVTVLNTMLERLKRAFDSQRRFTADASHELRSPLTAMRGELELALRRERGKEEYQDVIRSTLEEVGRLSRITEDLLTLARSDAGAMIPRRTFVAIDEVASRTAERLAHEASRKGAKIRVVSSGRIQVDADPDLLGRLVWNLLDNAIKHTSVGSEVVIVTREDEAGVHIEVLDSGEGFPPGAAEHFFDRFFREDEARSPGSDHDGTGLGLSIVQAIVRAHGGDIVLRNRREGGGHVDVRLPRSVQPAYLISSLSRSDIE